MYLAPYTFHSVSEWKFNVSHSNQHLTQPENVPEIARKSETRWKPPEDSRLTKGKEIKLIRKNVSGKRKEKVLRRGNWLTHQVKVILITLLKNRSHHIHSSIVFSVYFSLFSNHRISYKLWISYWRISWMTLQWKGKGEQTHFSLEKRRCKREAVLLLSVIFVIIHNTD